MRITTLLITAFSLFDIISSSGNSSLPTQNLSEELFPSWIIVQNLDSYANGDSKITLFQQLNLTTLQQKQIEQIHRLYYPKIIKLRDKLTVAKDELTSMMASTTSATTIRTKHQEILKIRQKLGELQLETMLATREVLTLEQRRNFADLLRSRR